MAATPGTAMLTGAAALLIVAALTAAAWALMIRMPGTSHAGGWQPLDAEEQAAARRLERDVVRLAQDIGERNVFRPGTLERAARLIETSLAEAGYAVASQRFESFGQPVRNLEADLPGTRTPGEIVLVGGHYDSVQGSPGANDNATGAAAMLELARRFAGRPAARSVRFVAFVNEEPPHFNIGEMGSQHYAREAHGRGDRIVAMLSLETIGYYADAPGTQHYPFPFNGIYPDRGNFIGFVGNLASRALVRRCLRVFRDTTAFPSEGVASPGWVPGVSWSDHGSFWPYGVPAVMVTDTALFRDPHYHAPTDTPRHVDFERMARVVGGLERVIRALADGD